MVKQITKYVADDGTEFVSPQEAAQYDLAAVLLVTIRDVCDMLNGAQQEHVAEVLSENPEALRDAVNTYFEDLEAWPNTSANPEDAPISHAMAGWCDGNHEPGACPDPRCWLRK